MKQLGQILNNSSKKLAILIDPDKAMPPASFDDLIKKINLLRPTFIFVGGSTVHESDLVACIQKIKAQTKIPIILFPGSQNQVSKDADGILFLSLLSGRNPDYLIGHQVQAAQHLKKMDIETISTAYLLIDGGKTSSVSYVSQTTPIPSDQTSIAVNTALAGQLLGFSCVFMDAGSGALNPVPAEMIKAVKKEIAVPLIIGGGIKNIEQLDQAYSAGADLVVIGNKIEEDIDFILDLKNFMHKKNCTTEI